MASKQAWLGGANGAEKRNISVAWRDDNGVENLGVSAAWQYQSENLAA